MNTLVRLYQPMFIRADNKSLCSQDTNEDKRDISLSDVYESALKSAAEKRVGYIFTQYCGDFPNETDGFIGEKTKLDNALAVYNVNLVNVHLLQQQLKEDFRIRKNINRM